MEYTIIDETTNISDEYCRYIYINNTSLSKPLCDEIIQKYESDDAKYDGITKRGHDKDIKNTTDMIITENAKWIKIKKAIYKELTKNLNNYIDNLNSCADFVNLEQQTTKQFKHFANYSHPPRIPTFMVQRYNKCVGKFIYHDDSHNDVENKRYRIITFLWYLNDVYEGGETVFSGKYAVKPTTGKLVLFPSTWNYPHCGKIPTSSDKYILTGWIYVPF